MSPEILFIGGFLCAALLPFLGLLERVKVQARLAVTGLVVLWLGLSAMFVWTAASGRYEDDVNREASVSNRPIQATEGDFVTSETCRSCHPHHHSTWHDSYHRTMTQIASPKSVIGNFDNIELADGDIRVRLHREGDRFLAETVMTRQGTFDGIHRTLPIVLTTGSHHMQFYWFSVSENVLGKLPFVYLKSEQRWVPARSSFLSHELSDSAEKLAVTFDEAQWNQVCIKCHTTHGRFWPANIDQDGVYSGPFDTEVVEFGIACEACHGPGEEHIRANRNPLHRYSQHLQQPADSFIVNPATLPHDLSSQVCGQCHSIFETYASPKGEPDKWIRNGFEFRPGQDLSKSEMRFIVPGNLDDIPKAERDRLSKDPNYIASRFWSDGMVRVTGREFNGLLKTPCYQKGDMSCLSCHQMHQSRDDPRNRKDWADDQLAMKMESNQACVQCHEKFIDESQLTDHTHHRADSSGSSCYNCHMPHTTYGLLKAIRSHQIESPSVKVSQQTGRPNACNQCHLDKTLAWTADHLHDFYGIEKPELSKDDQEIAASILWILRGDAGQRALAAWTYGWREAQEVSDTNWQAPYLAQLLEDPYDAVRFIAYRSLRSLKGYEDVNYDFVGPRADRAAAKQRTMALWSKSRKSFDVEHPSRVLIDGKGALMKDTFDRLLKHRDNRPVRLLE